jgi:hypothetical protein
MKRNHDRKTKLLLPLIAEGRGNRTVRCLFGDLSGILLIVLLVIVMAKLLQKWV